MSDDTSSKEAATPKPAPAEPVDAAEDESRRRFREALERKQHSAAGVSKQGHGPDRPGMPASNDKRRQNFRRKSGG